MLTASQETGQTSAVDCCLCTSGVTHSFPHTTPSNRHLSKYGAAQVGEFCEVFNDSKTDPAAWVAKVKKVSKKLFRVSRSACISVLGNIC